MERRVVLSSLAALAATPVLAQTGDTGAGVPANPQTPAAAPAMKVAPPIATSRATEIHMRDTVAVGSLSLLTSRIAAGKVKRPAVKQFTSFEIAEQETIADVLKGMMMPGAAPLGTVNPPTDAELTSKLDPSGKAMIEKMRAMKAGPDFDRAYVKAQIDGHRKLLEIQEAYLAKPDNIGEADLAKLARGMIKEHLALLADLDKSS